MFNWLVDIYLYAIGDGRYPFVTLIGFMIVGVYLVLNLKDMHLDD